MLQVYTASLYELAFTVMHSVSEQCCEVMQWRAQLVHVAGWVTKTLEQGPQGSCAHDGYHHSALQWWGSV